MSFSIEDQTRPMTTDEVKKSIYDVLGIIGVTTTKWKPGAVLRTMIAGTSVVLAGLSQLIALSAQSGFRQFARGAWLKFNAKYVYGVDALEASFATGPLMLTNTGSNVFNDVLPGDFVVRNPLTSKQYRNIVTFSVGALQADVPITIQAIEAGAASTAGANEIVELVTAFPGLVCTNPNAIVGSDDERDEDLGVRAGESLGAMSPNGPKDSYAFVARSARRPDGTAIGVNRVGHVTTGDGTLQIILATPSGPPPPEDLAIINDLIRPQCEPLTIDSTAEPAIPVTIAVTYTAYITNTQITTAEALEAINTAIINFISTYPIGGADIDSGGKLYLSALNAAIGSARALSGLAQGQALGVVRVTFTLPAADVALDPDEAPIAGTITGSIVHVRAEQL